MKERLFAIGVLMLVSLFRPQVLVAEGDERSAPTAASGPELFVRPLDAAAVRGKLIALDGETLSVTDADGGSRSWRISDLRSAHVDPAPAPIDEIPPVVLLANDDVLTGAVEGADEDTLTLSWTAVQPRQSLTVPLETVRSFALRQPDDELDRLRLRRIWALLEPQADRLISTDNTHVDGEFLGLAEGQVRLKSALGILAAPVEEVIAVVMNSELASTRKLDGGYLLVSFRDGSRLSLTSPVFSGAGGLSGTAAWGAEIAFPLESVARVQFLGTRVVSLSDLAPANYEFTSYLTQEYPLVANRNVHGGRLRLREEMFATGLGVSSKSEVTYDLEGEGYASFEAVIGVDDLTDGQGNVVFAVELDGQRVFESAPLSGRSAQQTIGPLEVTRARRLKLIVDFGQFGNIQDVADWCDAVLIKSPD